MRLIIGFSLLFTLFIIQLSIKEIFPVFFFYSFLVFIFVFSILYLVLYKLEVNPKYQLYIQLTGDFALISYLILMTGGYESNLVFLYIFPVLVASTFLTRRETITVSLIPIFLYLLISFIHYYRPSLLPVESFRRPFNHAVFFSYMVVYIFTFLLLGFFSSSITLTLKQTLERLSRSERALERLEAVNELIIERVGECFIVTDRDNRVILSNKYCREMVGKRLSEVLKGIPEEASEWEIACNNRFLKVKRVVIDKGKGIKAFIISDLTLEKEKEKRRREEEKLAALGEMVGIFAHEIRNPLATIVTSLQIYDTLGEAEKERLKGIIEEEVQKINELIEKFLRQEYSSTKVWFNLRDKLMEIKKSKKFDRMDVRVEGDIELYLDPNKFGHALSVILKRLTNNERIPLSVVGQTLKGGFKLDILLPAGKGNLNSVLNPSLSELETGEGLPLLIALREMRELGAIIASLPEKNGLHGISLKFKGEELWKKSS